VGEAGRKSAERAERIEHAARRAESQRDEEERQKREAAEAEQVEVRQDERRRAQERERPREEEARGQAKPLVASPAPTVMSDKLKFVEQPSIETMKAPAPDRVFSVGKDLTTDSRGVATVGETSSQSPARNRRAMIVVVGLFGVAVLLFIGWFVRGALNKNPSSDGGQPTPASESATGMEAFSWRAMVNPARANSV